MKRFVIALFALLPGGQAPYTLIAQERPNIVFLLTDDQRWDTMGCAGNPLIKTPEMDRLAAEGTRFRNAYVTTAICCVSRASILSGQYAARHGIHNFADPFTPEALAETYPQQLRAAGYRTGFIGKYGVGGKTKGPAESFDYWQAVTGQPRYEIKKADGSIEHYTDQVTAWTREFINGCSADQPFSLSVSYKSPHVQDGDPRQFISNPRYDALYAEITIPPADRGTDADFQRLPEVLANDSNEGRNRWKIRFSTPELYQQMVKGYYRLITGVDDAIKQLRSDLKQKGFDQNTIIIFAGDHGFYLGEHGLAGKWYGHEESIRIPLLVVDPRAPVARRGQVRDEMVLNIDIAPSILDFAGLPIPTKMQGKSLRPLLNGATPDWRQRYYYEHKVPIASIPKSEGVVSLTYKYLRYPETDPVQEELYDLTNDRGETRNLIHLPEHAALLETLRRQCDQLKTQAR